MPNKRTITIMDMITGNWKIKLLEAWNKATIEQRKKALRSVYK